MSKEITAIRAIRNSNELYESGVSSAYEIAKGSTRPIISSPNKLPTGLTEAWLQLESKKKLFRILRSKPSHDLSLAPGSLVEVFVKSDMGKQSEHHHSPFRKWEDNESHN